MCDDEKKTDDGVITFEDSIIDVDLADITDVGSIVVTDVGAKTFAMPDGSHTHTFDSVSSWGINSNIDADSVVVNGCDVEKELLSVRTENIELRNRLENLERDLAIIRRRMCNPK